MVCKTIILSNSENISNNAPKGILTLSNENNVIKGKIRLYNLLSLPQSTKLGLYVNEKVHIASIIHKPNHYEFSINNNIDITQSIYCALIDTSNNKKVLLEGGSFNGFYFTDSPFDAVLEAKDEQLEKNIDEALKTVDACDKCNCSNCEYKNYFYQQYGNNVNEKDFNTSQPNKSEQCETYFNPAIDNFSERDLGINKIQSNIIDKLQHEIIEDVDNFIAPMNNSNNITNAMKSNNIDISNETTSISSESNKQTNQDNKEKMEFLNDIIYQLDEMLEKNPPDDILNNIIPNSKFVKIENESPYVLGVIYEDNVLKYIAYGVPGEYTSLPPKELGVHYQWLPLNPRDVMSDGYFMIYQDAITGDLVEINFE